MSENGIDDTVVHGNIGEETMQVEEEGENKQQGELQEEAKILQADDELKQRVEARQEEKGKGGISDEEEVSDSGLLASEQNQQTPSLSKPQHEEVISQQRTKKSAKKSSKQKEEPNLYDLSKQLENHTKQLSKIGGIVQQLPKYLKNADTQSRIIKQLNSSMNQLQRQIAQIQKSVQKKSKQK
jgi:hypothetical protein